MKAWMVHEPLLNGGMLVRAVVIQDEMNGPAAGCDPVEFLQKTEELLMPVAGMTLGDYGAGFYVEGGKQGGRSVPPVIVSPAFRKTGPERQNRLCTIQRLDLALLIDAENQRSIRRVQVPADDIADLRHKGGVCTEFEGLHAMRLQMVAAPETMDRRRAHPLSTGHRADAPMSRILGLCPSVDSMMEASCSGVIRFGRPERGKSFRMPATPSA